MNLKPQILRIFANFNKLTMLRKTWLILGLGLIVAKTSNAQLSQIEAAEEININTITTAVPFLGIAPDSRSGGMGDAGVALSADANSLHWNPSKMAFAENEMEVALSYSPWLRELVNDMNLAYLSGYKKISDEQAVGVALRFFSLGTITFTDEQGTAIRDFKPAEFSFDVGFSQKLSEKFSGGIAARFINSNLTGGTTIAGTNSRPGRAVGVDVSFFYTNPDLEIADKDATWNWGLNISNIGNKMSYTETAERDFLPCNMRLGTALQMDMNEYNSLTLTIDANKLLVPTPPQYDPDDPTQIIAGEDPDVGVATAIFQSFNDAPEGFSEELREINLGGGLEYWYDKQFAFRTGFFSEHYTKGNRQFITLGAGLVYQKFEIDMSYLISTRNQNPLANTLRFSLKLNLDERGIQEG